MSEPAVKGVTADEYIELFPEDTASRLLREANADLADLRAVTEANFAELGQEIDRLRAALAERERELAVLRAANEPTDWPAVAQSFLDGTLPEYMREIAAAEQGEREPG